MYIIEDWACNRIFPDKKFDTFEEAWDYIYENIKEDFEDDGTYEEYFVVEVKE